MTQRDYPQHGNTDQGRETESQTYTSTFIREDDKPLYLCVVEAVAEVTERDPMELRPLYEIIDPDSLDQLFESPPQSRTGRVTFLFEGCRVTVDATGLIGVSPQPNEEE